MGWFSRDESVYDFEYVLAGGVRWPAFTDDDGVLFIDVDYEVDIAVDEVCIAGLIYPAWIDDDGRLRVEIT
jgi:hypothetical protein